VIFPTCTFTQSVQSCSGKIYCSGVTQLPQLLNFKKFIYPHKDFNTTIRVFIKNFAIGVTLPGKFVI